MATAKSRYDKGQPVSQWDERDKFQDDAIAIMRKHEGQHLYSITGEIYDDLVRPLKSGDPLHMLLAASMLVQRLRQYAKDLHGCCTVCTHHANDITAVLDEFATDSKGSTNQTEGR